MICAKAIDSFKRISNPYCFVIASTNTIPQLNQSTLSIKEPIKSSSSYQFKAEFNVNVMKPYKPAFIKLYSKETNQLVYSIDSSLEVDSTFLNLMLCILIYQQIIFHLDHIIS